jgi:hypothetical protein
MFMATHRIYRQKGEAYVGELIDRVCAKWAPAARNNAVNSFTA